MTQETEALIASDEDLTKLFAGKPTQYRKSKSLPKFTGEAMRACAKINRIFFDDPDEAYRLFHELVPDAGEGGAVHAAVQCRLWYRIDHWPRHVPQQGFHGVRRRICDAR